MKTTTTTTTQMTWQQCNVRCNNVRCSSSLLPSLESSPQCSSMLLYLSLFVDSDTCLNSVSIQDSDRVSIQTVSLNSDTCLDSDTFLLPSPLISSLLHDTLLLFHTRVSIQNFRRVSIQTCFRCPCSSHRLSAQVSILKNFFVFSPTFVQCLDDDRRWSEDVVSTFLLLENDQMIYMYVYTHHIKITSKKLHQRPLRVLLAHSPRSLS